MVKEVGRVVKGWWRVFERGHRVVMVLGVDILVGRRRMLGLIRVHG